MSEAESRILPWPGPGPGPRPPWGGWPGPWRPPAGAWPPGPLPPGPGPFPQPPDVFSAFAWLAKNYRESQAAKEFLKLLIQDMIAEDPTFLANAHATVGVTDGSAAQPGMVGEIWEAGASVAYPAGQQNTITSAGVLPAGDWNIWAWSNCSTPMLAAQIDNSTSVADTTPPPGFSWFGGALYTTGTGTELELVTNQGYARTAVPTLVTIRTRLDSGTAGPGTLTFGVMARRMR